MRTIAISFLAAMTLIIAACGSGDSEAISDPPTTTTAVDYDTTTPDDTTTTEPPVTTTTAPDTTTGPDTTTAPDTTTPPRDAEVFVYLLSEDTGSHDYGCGYVTPVSRIMPLPAVLSGALDELFAGPTDAEIGAGYQSWFQGDVGWELSKVTITDGVAYVDLTEDSKPIPNASTSCGSMALLAQLDLTATQFPTVDRAVYSFDGDVEAFYHWLQRDVPQ